MRQSGAGQKTSKLAAFLFGGRMTNEEKFKSEVIGVNKDRDFSILYLLSQSPELTQPEVVDILRLNLSQERISQIVTTNQRLLFSMTAKLNPLSLDEGRVYELIKHYRKKRSTTKKDPLEIIEAIRKELKGDRALIDVKVQNITYKASVNENGRIDIAKLTSQAEGVHQR